MKIFELYTEQIVDTDLKNAWDFFSTPLNLSKITPVKMHFEVLSKDAAEKIYAGKLIEYNVRPILNIKMHWLTEITQVKENEYFIDEQRFGPYAFWHHKHFFKPIHNGVLLIDHLHYALPFGILGRIVNALFIQKKVKAIFEYRTQILNQIFNHGVVL
jgi:ligand-binding SRPBCC domain-containing protein